MSKDSDIAETFKDLRQASQEKREHNRRYSTKLLSAKRIKFNAVNGGYHLIITELADELIDFWPSTGLWKSRISKEKNRGIKPLMEYILNGGISGTSK